MMRGISLNGFPNIGKAFASIATVGLIGNCILKADKMLLPSLSMTNEGFLPKLLNDKKIINFVILLIVAIVAAVFMNMESLINANNCGGYLFRIFLCIGYIERQYEG